MDVTRSLGSARRDGVMDRLNDDSRIRGARLSACRADLSPVLDRFGHVPLLLAAAACFGSAASSTVLDLLAYGQKIAMDRRSGH